MSGCLMELKYISRGTGNPRGKARVYFSYHPADAGLMDHICDMILKKQDCAIYYYDYAEGEPDTDELFPLLEQMQLFVVPVTSAYLLEECNAYRNEFFYAFEKHIPILPLMQSGSAELIRVFGEKCSNIQYLDEYDDDMTAIPFEEKLKRYLDSVLIPNDLADNIRAAFDAYVFLSYRKKDREQANELMRLIHDDERLRKIAIWYDEYLVAGEPFDEAIRKALADSDIFALLVTPSLLEKDNFVMREEFPMAREQGKDIIPLESIKTDRKLLEENYNGIPECVDAKDKNRISDEFIKRLKKLAISENDDPVHDYLIGLAFLMGIDTEKNPEHALKLIRSAADKGLPEAYKKLADMYYNGIGVEKDIFEAVKWQRSVVDIYKSKYDNSGSDDAAMDLWEERNRLADRLMECFEIEEAERAYKDNIEMGEAITGLSGDDPHLEVSYGSIRLLAYSYGNIAVFLKEHGKISEAEDYYERSIIAMEMLVKMSPGDKAKEDLANAYTNLAGCLSARGEHVKAEEKLISAIGILSDLAKDDPDKYAYSLARSYINGGVLYDCMGDLEEAESYYLKSVDMLKPMTERDEGKYVQSLAHCYCNLTGLYRNQGKIQSAIEYAQKGIEILEALFEKDNLLYAEDLAGIYCNAAIAYDCDDDIMTAEKLFMRALSIYDSLAQYDPSRYDQLFTDCLGNAVVFYRSHGYDEAAENYENMIIDRRKNGRRQED